MRLTIAFCFSCLALPACGGEEEGTDSNSLPADGSPSGSASDMVPTGAASTSDTPAPDATGGVADPTAMPTATMPAMTMMPAEGGSGGLPVDPVQGAGGGGGEMAAGGEPGAGGSSGSGPIAGGGSGGDPEGDAGAAGASGQGGGGGAMATGGTGGSGGAMMDADAVALASITTTGVDPGHQDVSGAATFTQNGDEVTLLLELEGCADGPLISHIHVNASCDNQGNAAGNHWIPNGELLGDYSCDGGMASYTLTVGISEWTIGAGDDATDVDGRSFMVHNGTSVAPGDRVACGVIEVQ